MTDGRASTYRIRQARPDELPLLPAIETAAADLFRQSAYPWIADEPNGMDAALFERCQDTWCLWVATDAAGLPVGFAAFAPEDDQIWLGELSVHPDHHRRGLGAALIDKAAGFYGPRGIPRMTLTTFRDVPWNAPYYARLGFAMIDDLSAEPFLAAQIEKEEGWGAPEGSRVAMQRILDE
ncbi:GNAT family N-acetyltransferase [Thalassobaculum sp.]|uniref:GNAT family N-acetyltransferase n=1 Tax=Thalassobaculum sp. TaxID=2022740 RepID=UPI0032EDB89A